MVAALVLVAGSLSWPGIAVAAPGHGSGSGSKVQPRGDGNWRPGPKGRNTAVPYKRPSGKDGPQVLKPDPHAKRVKELTDQRTANTSSFRMSDGSVQQEVSALPVHYRDAKGAWQTIGTAVRPVDHRGFTVGAQANSFQTYFSPKASSLLRIEQGSTFVQVGADGASTAAPKVKGAAVSYPGAYPGADLGYQVGPQGVKESIVLSKAPKAGQSYSFTMTVGGGLVPRQLPDGAIALHGKESSTAVFTIPAPYMSDAKADVNSPYGKVYSAKVSQTMRFDAATGVLRVTVKPDAAWLGDGKRVYPVTIDPTIMVSPTPSTGANTMILADSPTDNFSTSWRLSVGTTTTGAARSLIKFPLPSIPAGTTITSADLALYYDQTFTDGSRNVPMQALQANTGWDATTATWNSASSIGGPVVGTSTMTGNALAVWDHFPVTPAVQSWVNGSPNNGFVIKTTNEASLGLGGPRFEGSMYAYSGEVVNYPKLTITYGVPGVAVNPPSVIHATGAELSWPAYANTTGDPANDLAEYQVHRTVYQTFTPGQNTLVAPVAAGSTTFVDSTAEPTPANSSDPYGNAYYYMVAVKTKGGKLIPGPTQLVRLPKAGRTTILIPAAAATTLSSSQPTAVLDTLSNAGTPQPWLEVGDNSPTYGVTRSVFDFGQLGQVPAGSRVIEAHLKVWQETTTTNTSGAVYELHGLTRSFTGGQATWNSAATGTAWTTPGGDFAAAAAGTVSGLTNDPNRQNFDATSTVQGWVTTAGSDHGLLVKLKSETSSSPQEHTIFAGPNTAEPRLAPQLVVTYLDNSTGATYYAPSTPTDMVVGTTYTTPVTINNTTGTTWSAGSEVLTYHWMLPDGTDATTSADQLQTALPSDLAPGDTVTLNAQVTPPTPTDSNESDGYSIAWDMYNKTTGTYLSAGAAAKTAKTPGSAAPAAGTSGTGSLKQQVSVDPTGNNQLGLEQFYQYTTTPTGSGTNLYTNASSGNTVWNDDLFSNPSRGFDTLLRLSYNSLSTFDTSTGFGWSVQASAPIRLGQAMEFHPQKNPTQVVLVDGTGNAHQWTLNTTTNTWASPPGVHLYLQQLASCGPQTTNARAWSMTRPDGTVYYFDCDGYPTASVDGNGNEADFTYSDRQSNNKPTEFLTYITDPAARQTLTLSYYNKGDSFSYIDSTGALVAATNLTDPAIIDHVRSITDISGRTVDLYYTSEGLLGRVVDGAGDPAAKTFNFTYDATQGMKNVKLVAVQDPRGNTTHIAYYPPSSPSKWLTQSVTDRLGHGTSFAYLEPGTVTGSAQQTTVTDADNHAYVYQIDSSGRMIQAVNPLNQKTTLGWDGDNNVTTLTEDNGARTTWTYDGSTGYPLTRIGAVANGDGTHYQTTYNYQFQLNGHIAYLTDVGTPGARHSHYTYNTFGDMLTAVDPNGMVSGAPAGSYTTTYTYDGFGQLQTQVDANNHTTRYADYDPSGQPTHVTDAAGNTTTMTYGPRGEVRASTDPLGHTSTQHYDVFLRPLDSQIPKDQAAGVYVTTPAPVYDGDDNVTRSTAPNGAVTTNGYDADDQMTSTTLPADTGTSPTRTLTYTYDAVGDQVTTTEPDGNVPGAVPGSYTTTVEYDAIGEPTAVTDALGKKTVTEYDDVGNTSQVTDPLKNVTQYHYDLEHRVLSVTDAQTHTASATYDPDGYKLSTTDQNGVTVWNTYDADGQLTQVQSPHTGTGSTAVNDTTQYTYDQVGNQTSVISPKGVASGQTGAYTTSTVYDADNRVSKQLGAILPGDANYGAAEQPETDYTYDAAGRQTQVTQFTRGNGLTPTSATSTSSYFDNGWVKQTADPFHIATHYDYNALGQQTSRVLTASDGTASRSMSWSYYPDGKLLATSDSGTPNGWQDQIVTASSFNTEILAGWNAGPSGAGFDGSTYYTNSSTANAFTWNLTVPQTGNYSIYVWYPNQGSDANPAASYKVNGSNADPVDQSKNAGTWVALTNPTNNGEWSLTAGTGQSIVLTPNGAPTAADAVRIVRDNSGDTQPLPIDFSYTYDANGNPTGVADASPTAQFTDYAATFDQLNRPTQLLEKNGDTVKHTLIYGYDADGNLISQKNDAAINTYNYDSRNQLIQVVNKQSSADAGITTGYTYTPTGQQHTQTKGNGNNVAYTYNSDGTPATIVESTVGGTTVDSHRLSYDPNNNITQDITSIQNADNNGATLDRTVTRGYSPNNQVTSVTNSDGKFNQTYTYNSAGNITEQVVNAPTGTNDVNFIYDRGRVSASLVGGFTGTYQYDTLGRLHAVANGTIFGRTNSVGQQYNYDGYDNITSQSSTDSGNLVNTTAYTYDSLNRPVTQTGSVNGIQIGQATLDYLGTSRTLADELISFNGAGSDSKTYDYAPNGERLALLDSAFNSVPTAQTSYYTYDPHQDVEALTNQSGTTQATYGYTAYGADDTTLDTGLDKDSTGIAFPYNSYRFNSARVATSTGNLDMGFRTYNPNTNQFISRDMYNGAGADAGLAGDRYGFAGGNPVSNIELDGHDWKSTVGSIAAGVGIFAGCAALGVATEGAGLVLCGLAAGAGSGAAAQGINCGEGQAGACSAGAFTQSITVGAITGAVTAGVGGEIAGALPSTMSGWASGAIVGAGSGAVGGGLGYGLTCTDCSWTGLAEATGAGAALGGVLGAGFGAVSGRTDIVTKITNRLQALTDQAAAEVDAGTATLLPREQNQMSNPRLAAVGRGNAIDRIVKERAAADPFLSRVVYIARHFPPEAAPDFWNVDLKTWWDMTTPEQWADHLNDYEDDFGTGILLPTRPPR